MEELGSIGGISTYALRVGLTSVIMVTLVICTYVIEL